MTQPAVACDGVPPRKNGPVGLERKMMMKATINLATYIHGLVKLTNENDETVDAKVSVEENGFDPVDSVRVSIEPHEPKPFTCHVLFPEIMLDAMPSRLTLDIKVHSEETNVVFDGADKEGPCVALPVYRGGQWVQGSNTLDLSKPYMVWKEKRERQLSAPLRIKYLLIMSNKGGPIDVELRGITIEE